MMKYEIKKNYMPLEEVREMIEMYEKLEKDYMDDYTRPDSKYIPNGGERLEYPAIPQLPEDADKDNYVLYSDKGQMVWITINDFLMKLGIREMIQKITEEFE